MPAVACVGCCGVAARAPSVWRWGGRRASAHGAHPAGAVGRLPPVLLLGDEHCRICTWAHDCGWRLAADGALLYGRTESDPGRLKTQADKHSTPFRDANVTSSVCFLRSTALFVFFCPVRAERAQRRRRQQLRPLRRRAGVQLQAGTIRGWRPHGAQATAYIAAYPCANGKNFP
eukprot:7381291-Prymnesium_polylepis.2